MEKVERVEKATNDSLQLLEDRFVQLEEAKALKAQKEATNDCMPAWIEVLLAPFAPLQKKNIIE